MIAFGIAPMPACSVAPSGIRSATSAGDPPVDVVRVGRRATSTSGRSASVQPATWLTWIWLRPNVRGMPPVGLEEEPRPPDERRHVVGADPEAEVAVAVGRRGRAEHERVVRGLAARIACISLKLLGHEVERSRPDSTDG